MVLTTAEGIDPELVETIKAKLTQAVSTRDNIELETKVNPKLIGGFMIEYDDNLYDASIAHQLHNMKKAFRCRNHLLKVPPLTIRKKIN
ncbi:MAG: F0F1 ATP synthase subunit delta [Saprospiraceae bacterium]|nr:F0F1 ATP synthase subunit delta [Saprospiraceae bacterium]